MNIYIVKRVSFDYPHDSYNCEAFLSEDLAEKALEIYQTAEKDEGCPDSFHIESLSILSALPEDLLFQDRDNKGLVTLEERLLRMGLPKESDETIKEKALSALKGVAIVNQKFYEDFTGLAILANNESVNNSIELLDKVGLYAYPWIEKNSIWVIDIGNHQKYSNSHK